MKESRIANRYAKALFELAIEMNLLEAIRADAELIDRVCMENREFVLMLRSPVIRSDKNWPSSRQYLNNIFRSLPINSLSS